MGSGSRAWVSHLKGASGLSSLRLAWIQGVGPENPVHLSFPNLPPPNPSLQRARTYSWNWAHADLFQKVYSFNKELLCPALCSQLENCPLPSPRAGIYRRKQDQAAATQCGMAPTRARDLPQGVRVDGECVFLPSLPSFLLSPLILPPRPSTVHRANLPSHMSPSIPQDSCFSHMKLLEVL